VHAVQGICAGGHWVGRGAGQCPPVVPVGWRACGGSLGANVDPPAHASITCDGGSHEV
jgi:hypothetical protein